MYPYCIRVTTEVIGRDNNFTRMKKGDTALISEGYLGLKELTKVLVARV